MITAHDFLTEGQSQAVTQQVKDLSWLFQDRDSFYTLGAATYQDNPVAYPFIADAFNKPMYHTMKELYEKLWRELPAIMGVDLPCSTPFRGFGLAGFHIFDSKSQGLSGSVHVDEPYDRLDLSDYDWRDPFSFTVPVELPTLGGGCDFWFGCTDEDIEIFETHNELPPETYVPYELGKLYLHDGKTPHRIANPNPIPDGEYRITLQGHGFVTDKGIIVYF